MNNVSIKNWYLSDGHLRKNFKAIQLSTDSFDEDSVNVLVDSLSGLGFSPKPSGGRIYLYRNVEIRRFLEMIGDLPISMKYKGVVPPQ